MDFSKIKGISLFEDVRRHVCLLVVLLVFRLLFARRPLFSVLFHSHLPLKAWLEGNGCSGKTDGVDLDHSDLRT